MSSRGKHKKLDWLIECEVTREYCKYYVVRTSLLLPYDRISLKAHPLTLSFSMI